MEILPSPVKSAEEESSSNEQMEELRYGRNRSWFVAEVLEISMLLVLRNRFVQIPTSEDDGHQQWHMFRLTMD